MNDDFRKDGVTLEREESGENPSQIAHVELLMKAYPAISAGQYEPYVSSLIQMVNDPEGDLENAAEGCRLVCEYYRGCYGGEYAENPDVDRVRFYAGKLKELGRSAQSAGQLGMLELLLESKMALSGANVADLRKRLDVVAPLMLEAVRGNYSSAMDCLRRNSDFMKFSCEEHEYHYCWGLLYLACRKMAAQSEDPLVRQEAGDRARLILREIKDFCEWDFASNKVLQKEYQVPHFQEQAAIALEADPQGEEKELLSKIAASLGMTGRDVAQQVKKSGSKADAASLKVRGSGQRILLKFYPLIAAVVYFLVMLRHSMSGGSGILYYVGYPILVAAVLFLVGAAIAVPLPRLFQKNSNIFKVLAILVVVYAVIVFIHTMFSQTAVADYINEHYDEYYQMLTVLSNGSRKIREMLQSIIGGIILHLIPSCLVALFSRIVIKQG